jgi:hypothetical protein
MWAIYTVIASLFSAAYYFGNQSVKVNPHAFMFYRGFVPSVVLLPLIFFVPFIPVWQFYVACVLQGCIIVFIDYRNYRAMRVWGAEIISSLHPLSIGLVFLLWFVLNPQYLLTSAQNMYWLGGTVAALCGVIYAASSYRNTRRSRQAFYYTVPYLFGAAACDVLNKVCMGYVAPEQLIYGSYFYILITGMVVALFNLLFFYRQNRKIAPLFAKNNLGVTPIMVMLIGSMLMKNFAMFNTANPSYVAAVLYLYIIWIMLFTPLVNRIGIKCPQTGLKRSKALLLLLSIIILILLNQ